MLPPWLTAYFLVSIPAVILLNGTAATHRGSAP